MIFLAIRYIILTYGDVRKVTHFLNMEMMTLMTMAEIMSLQRNGWMSIVKRIDG